MADVNTDKQPIDDRAIDSLSVAPDADDKLDEALDETMDASDPVSVTQPGHNDPAPSSGYSEAEEAERQRDA